MSNELSIILYISVYTVGASLLSKKNNKQAIWIGLLLPVIFAGCRFKVGTDFWQYMNNFVRWDSYSWGRLLRDSSDIALYKVVAKITFGLGGRVLTWGTLAALVLVPVYFELKKEYDHVPLYYAMLIFLLTAFTSSFNLSKQYIAVSLVFVSLKYIVRNKPWQFIFYILLATLFHETAAIMVLVWFLWDHKNERPVEGMLRLFFILVAFVLVFYYRQVISWLSSNVSLFDDFSNYANDKSANNRDFIVAVVKLVLILFAYKPLVRMDNRNSFFVTLYALSVLIGITGFTHPQVKRMGAYFSVPAEILLFAQFPFCFTRGQEQFGKAIVFVLYIGVFVLTYYILGQSHMLPYNFDVTSVWN